MDKKNGMQQNTSLIAEKDMQSFSKERYHYSCWRGRAIKRLPGLSAKISALRGKKYPGCGFHYSLETALANSILSLTSLEGRKTYLELVADEVLFSSLFADVARIERYIEAEKVFLELVGPQNTCQ